MYIILTVTTLVFLFFGLQLKYEEDISRLLPSSSVESQLAFTSIELKDKIYIQVTRYRLDAVRIDACVTVTVLQRCYNRVQCRL